MRLLLAILVVFRFLLCHSQREKTLRNLLGFFSCRSPGIYISFNVYFKDLEHTSKKKLLLILFIYFFMIDILNVLIPVSCFLFID